jgi:hypothetical protein
MTIINNLIEKALNSEPQNLVMGKYSLDSSNGDFQISHKNTLLATVLFGDDVIVQVESLETNRHQLKAITDAIDELFGLDSEIIIEHSIE